MWEKVGKIAKEVLTSKKLFWRIFDLLLLVVGSIILIQNVSCGLTPNGRFWFAWKPAAKIEVTKKI